MHGVCEVIERDSMWRLRDPGLRTGARDRYDDDPSPPSASPARTICAGGHADAGGRRTGPTGVPCFIAFLSDEESPGRYYGAGCHPIRSTALLRALTEAAQSRLGHIAGSRDDLFRRSDLRRSTRQTTLNRRRRPLTRVRSFEHIPDVTLTSWTGVLGELVSRVRKQTGMPPLAVDLARPDFDVPVVMVVAPGMHLIPPGRR